MSTPRLAVMVPPSPDVTASAQLARVYEDVGVDVIGVPEAYGVDAVSWLGYLASVTDRVELMSQVLPIYPRTPALTAMTAVGLDRIAQGRFLLGLGVSGPQVVEGWHGVAYDAPLGRTRDVIEICRKVWRGERLEYDGVRYRIPMRGGTGLGKPLKLVDVPLRAGIPIYVAALGPGNTELTAELADGWVPFLYIPERADAVWGEPLARGTLKRSADLAPLEIVAGGPMAIGDDVTHLRELDRDHLALYVGGMGARDRNFYNTVVRRYGFEEQAREVQDLYLAGRRAEAAAALPDELLEGTSLIGDVGYLRDRLAAYRDRGVTIVQVQPVGDDPIADLRRFRTLLDDC
ncbi:LLM class F420-dependent oxidoreductase [Gordonia rhizosphera]|uniref:Putative F420-dependent oxidoreductase n=1 Tax=Gordonia rhizosphera NBRC 16068 TaxID=1108045 RepID=K6VRL3_9ACTN|nr:LLM class F420-dependent oxidoreductase [Gordonia rhizosphera]GAB89565.1 putative F420-dependent oxidoreductase [Gordonia rhizosphera NBRC 16068]